MADLSERLTDIQNAPGVIGANEVGSPVPVYAPLIHMARIRYWATDGDVVKDNTVSLIVVNYGLPDEAAYWLGRLPSELVPDPPAETYITDRSTPFTAAQIESYCNTLWVDARPTAGPILEFEVSNVNGKTVRVSGRFDVGSGVREQREYYIWFADANGATTPGDPNVKFEQVT